MRAYGIVQRGAEPDFLATADALVFDSEATIHAPSSRAGGEATQGHACDGDAVALDCFASLAMTGGTVRRMLRVGGIEAPDLDAWLAGTVLVAPDAIVLPARHGRDVGHLGSRLAVHEAVHGLPDGGIGIVAIFSCAAGVLAAASFVGASRRLCGLGWDAHALARQLGGAGQDPWGSHPVLAQARAVLRLTAAAAGVEAIETAYPGDDAEAFGAQVAAARRDGFGAMFARDPAQARLIRDGA